MVDELHDKAALTTAKAGRIAISLINQFIGYDRYRWPIAVG